jgi:hypothetical protein
MITAALFGLLSLIWLAVGLAMVATPAWWNQWVRRTMTDALSRFLLLQAMMLGGLVLVLGASTYRGYWLWVFLGALQTAKALILLGAPHSLRERLLAWWERSPLWAHRLAGVTLTVLATLLAIDTLRGGS